MGCSILAARRPTHSTGTPRRRRGVRSDHVHRRHGLTAVPSLGQRGDHPLAARLRAGLFDFWVVDVHLKSRREGECAYRIRRRRDGVACFSATVTTVLIALDSQESQAIPDDLRNILEQELGS